MTDANQNRLICFAMLGAADPFMVRCYAGNEMVPIAQLPARPIGSGLLRQRVAWKTSKARKGRKDSESSVSLLLGHRWLQPFWTGRQMRNPMSMY